MSANKSLDALWDALWEDLRHNATGRPSGLLIVTRHRQAIEQAAREPYHPPDGLLAMRTPPPLFEDGRPNPNGYEGGWHDAIEEAISQLDLRDTRPDPAWRLDAEGYVTEPLVNEGTLRG